MNGYTLLPAPRPRSHLERGVSSEEAGGDWSKRETSSGEDGSDIQVSSPPLPPRRPRMEPPPGTAAGQEEQELRERAFFSWAEFSRFFDAWCQQRLALFFVKSSMHLARCRWASAPPLYTLIDVLKYSYVRLVCKDVRAPSRPAVGCVSRAGGWRGGGVRPGGGGSSEPAPGRPGGERCQLKPLNTP